MNVTGDRSTRAGGRAPARPHLQQAPARMPLSPPQLTATLPPARLPDPLLSAAPAIPLPAPPAAGALAAGTLASGALAAGTLASRAPGSGVPAPTARADTWPTPDVAGPATGAAPGLGPGTLPAASRLLAIIARPGQESAELGAVLAAYQLRGAQLAVLCLTRGEASELNSTSEQLEEVRPWELQVAAELLGVSSVTIADYPDGRLAYLPPTALASHVRRAIRRTGAELLLVIDPAAVADLDTAAVARAARLAAERSGLPVLARTLPGPGGRWRVDLGPDGPIARARQRRAIDAHLSQRPLSHGDEARQGVADGSELVRWLVPPAPGAGDEVPPSGTRDERAGQPPAVSRRP